MKEIRNCFLLKPFGINGIVLWPFIFYAEKDPHPRVKNHEAIHAAQIAAVGVPAFYVRYLREYFAGRRSGLSHDEAYRNISFEKEAYEHQENLSYLTDRPGGRTSPTSSRSREPS